MALKPLITQEVTGERFPRRVTDRKDADFTAMRKVHRLTLTHVMTFFIGALCGSLIATLIVRHFDLSFAFNFILAAILATAGGFAATHSMAREQKK